METDQLIHLLAADIDESLPVSFYRRMTIGLAFAGTLSFVLMAWQMEIRPDFLQALLMPLFWLKFGFAAALALAGFYAIRWAVRPGARAGGVVLGFVAPVIVIWICSAWTLERHGAQPVSELIYGDSWEVCPILITVLAAPIFFAVMRVMKEMAPTQLPLAGFVAGLFSGAAGACIYCLHCPELSPVFVGIWYLLGILIPGAIGALVGKRVLAW